MSINAKAQDKGNSTVRPLNNINTYIGLFDFNINYERTVMQNLKSFSNARIGFGAARFIVAGEGKYINVALVQLIEKKSSHVEIDLGVKYLITNSISNPKFYDTFIHDIFLGYRFEKSSGGFICRTGFNYPTLLNVGIGYKF